MDVQITQRRMTTSACCVMAMMAFSIGWMPPAAGDPISESQNDPNSSPKWLLGTYDRHVSQRLSQDNGLDVLIQDQRLGHVPFVFVGQREDIKTQEAARQSSDDGDADWLSRKARDKTNQPGEYGINSGDLVLLHGQFVTEKIRSVVYTGVKRVEGERDFDYTYFLANDDFQKLGHIELTVDAEKRTVHAVLPTAKLPADVRGLEAIVSKPELLPVSCHVKPIQFSTSGPTRIKVEIPPQFDLTFSVLRITNVPAPASISSTCARAFRVWLPPFSLDPQWAASVPTIGVAIELDPRGLMREALEKQELPNE